MPKEIKAPKAKRGKRLPKMLIDGAAQDELDKMGGARVFDAKRLVASGKMRGKDNEVRYQYAEDGEHYKPISTDEYRKLLKAAPDKWDSPAGQTHSMSKGEFTAYEHGIEDGQKNPREPMGVSQWMRYGENLGYASYWRRKEQAKKARAINSANAEDRQRLRLNRDRMFALAHKENTEENKQMATILLYWSIGFNILLGITVATLLIIR